MRRHAYLAGLVAGEAVAEGFEFQVSGFRFRFWELWYRSRLVEGKKFAEGHDRVHVYSFIFLIHPLG